MHSGAMVESVEKKRWELELLIVVANQEYIERLRTAINELHKCRATHKTTVYVKEEAQGKIVWEGDVEVFSLFGHPRAKFCYGWSVGEGGEFITILELPPVSTPQAAVKVGMARNINQPRR